MLLPRPLVLLILLPFAAYSTYAIAQVGYLAIFTSHFHTAGFQVLADLVIACATPPPAAATSGPTCC